MNDSKSTLRFSILFHSLRKPVRRRLRTSNMPENPNKQIRRRELFTEKKSRDPDCCSKQPFQPSSFFLAGHQRTDPR